MQGLPLEFFVDRRELLAILRLVTRQRRGSSILLLEAQANMGKSFLLRKMQDVCDAVNIPCALIDLGNVKDEGLSCQAVIEKIQRDVYHPTFTSVLNEFFWQPPLPDMPPNWGASPRPEAMGMANPYANGGTQGDVIIASNISGKGIAVGPGAFATVNEVTFLQSDSWIQEQRIARATAALVGMLTQVTAEQPWVLLFDAYGAGVQRVEKWVCEQFLPPLIQGYIPNLFVLIAGQANLPTLRINQHKILGLRCQLDKFDSTTVARYMEKRAADRSRLHDAFKWSANGVPGQLSFAVDIIVAEVAQPIDEVAA